MLNWNRVLLYVKSNLALPSTYIEKTDEEIQEYLKQTALYEFSTYFPGTGRCAVNANLERFIVPNYNNRFYFFNDDDPTSEIIGIKDVYFNSGNTIMTGHPIMGPTTFNQMSDWMLQVYKSNFFRKYSLFGNKTYKFFEPNIVEILANSGVSRSETFVVEFECVQPKDLSTIPTTMSNTFMDLCLAHMELMIGATRSQYSNLSTPFGDIPINADALISRGEDRKQKMIDRLAEETIPPVIININ